MTWSPEPPTPAPPPLTPPLPREHGTWAMLYAPLVIGLASGREFSVGQPFAMAAALLLVVSATAAFLAQAMARSVPRRGAPSRGRHIAWCGIFMAIAMTSGLALVVIFRLGALLPLAAFAAFALVFDMVELRSLHGSIRIAREIIAAATFSLAAPAGAVVARGQLDRFAFALWLLNTLFFTSSILTVRAWIDGVTISRRLAAGRLTGEETARSRAGGDALALYHLALVLFMVGVLAGRALISRHDVAIAIWWTAAFIPPIARAFHARARAVSLHPALRTVGLMELGWTVLFMVMMIAGSQTGR